MSVLDRIYDASPVFFQNIMCSVKGWLIQRRRFNDHFFEELKKYEKRVYDPEKELIDFLYDIRETPVYKNILTEEFFERCQNEKGRIYTEIKRFPIIDKPFVKFHSADIVNKSCKEPAIIMRTSGTTGSGLVFPYTIKMENRHWAIWWRYRRALGINIDTWYGWFGGKRIIDPNNKKAPFWRINRPGKQVMYSSAHMNLKTIADFHADIKKRGLIWLHGYPSHIARFAALALDQNLPAIDCVKFVTTGAENTLGNQIELIRKIFPNAIIRQHYGLMEGVANISQNKNGDWIVDDDFAYVEFIPVTEDNPNICRIVGTGFSNPAFPLVRYDTGDLATISRDSEGNLKIISIDGRSSNVLKGPDGFEINEARLSIILHDFMNIIEAQFHQKTLTEIELMIVKNSSYNANDEKLLLQNLNSCFDKRMNVGIKYVDEIPKSKSGKLKLVVSDLS